MLKHVKVHAVLKDKVQGNGMSLFVVIVKIIMYFYGNNNVYFVYVREKVFNTWFRMYLSCVI